MTRKAKESPSQAKNFIKRALKALGDPHPTKEEKSRCLEWFGQCCAYCGQDISGTRSAQYDHLDASFAGGVNHISNRVPACGVCNGDEKRELGWEEFLRGKCKTKDELELRRTRIVEWRRRRSEGRKLAPNEINELIVAECERVCLEFDQAVSRIRSKVAEEGDDGNEASGEY